MKKHIYLHTSNLENVREFKEDDSFNYTSEYPKEWLDKTNPYEYGIIETKSNFYHILIGNIRNEKCPWCHGLPVFQKIREDKFGDTAQFSMVCQNCGSRGPIITINMPIIQSDEHLNEIKRMIHARYSTRLHWDHDLKNPFELGEK